MILRAARFVALVALISAAVGIAVAALPLARFPERATPQVPQGALAVASRVIDFARPVQVEVEWSDPFVSRSAIDGMVTSTPVQPGDRLACGSVAVVVEDRPVAAYCGPYPLWRDIGPASQGDDAEAVWRYLGSLGYLDAADVDQALLETAIARFRDDLGMMQGSSLSVSDLAWVGDDGGLAVDALAIGVGDVIATGAELLIGERFVTAAAVSGLPMDPPPEHFAVSLGSDLYSLNADGSIVDLEALAAAVERTTTPSDEPPRQLEAVARLASPVSVWAVPATGIVSGSSGTCVVLIDSTGEGTTTVEVDVVDYSTGTAMVRGALSEGQLVVAIASATATC